MSSALQKAALADPRIRVPRASGAGRRSPAQQHRFEWAASIDVDGDSLTYMFDVSSEMAFLETMLLIRKI